MVDGKVAIVTDSTASLSAEEISRYGVRVVPLRVIFGTEIYIEGVDITSEEYYRRLAARGPMPTTSQPAISDFTRLYSELAERGHPVLSVHISSILSGTVRSAMAARQELPGAQIEIVDCRSVALRMLIAPAVRAAAKGQSLPQLKETIERLNSCLCTVGMLDTLDYLWKGGRIGGAKALLGTLLRIKPLLDFRNGEVKILAKLRTASQAIEAILEIVRERVGPAAPIHIGVAHTHALEPALELEERVKAGFNCAEIDVAELGPVLATHLGPGFFGVAFYSGGEWHLD
jgi:DegV family protein with EDD domain